MQRSGLYVESVQCECRLCPTAPQTVAWLATTSDAFHFFHTPITVGYKNDLLYRTVYITVQNDLLYRTVYITRQNEC